MKLKKFTLSSFTLSSLLSAGVKHYEVVGNPLPDDVKIVRVLPSYIHGEVYLVLQSESFAECEEGKPVPEYGPLTVKTF